MTYAENIAWQLNQWLKTGDVQICNYARRFIIKKGNTMTVSGNLLQVNGKGPAFIAGTFQAYKH